MALQQTLRPAAPFSTVTPNWNPVCHITYTRDTWVKLLQRPSS